MEYIGLHAQIKKNNFRSTLLLISFPAIILIGVYVFFYFAFRPDISAVNQSFLSFLPFLILGVGIWFVIAYFSHSSIIKRSSRAKTLSRKENMEVYNLTENLCISVGMKMPKLYIINSSGLNAFASGIDEKSYAITLSAGIIEALDEKELEGVIAHELTHIRNKDVRLLIISIIFVGILGFFVQILLRSFLYGGRRRDSKSDPRVMMIALAIAAVVYFLTIIFKFALSRKREYLADAGAVELTKNSHALASALRKISGNPEIDVKSADIKQMFIENGSKKKGFMSSLKGMFATHPPIDKRIAILEKGL